MKRILLCLLLSLSALWASDLVVLTDGSMHIGRIVRYEADKALLFEDLKGIRLSIPMTRSWSHERMLTWKA